MFVVEKSRLAPALDVVRAGLPLESAGWRRCPVLMDLRRGSLRLAAGTRALHAEATAPANGADASVLVSSEVVDIVSYLEGPICFERDKSVLTLAAGGSRLNLACSSVRAYPNLSMGQKILEGSVPAADFVRALRFLTAAIASTDRRPESGGVLFRWKRRILTLVAGDRCTLAVVRIPVDVEGTADRVLPARVVSELIRLIESADPEQIAIVTDLKAVQFSVSDAVLISSVVEAPCVDWAAAVARASLGRAAHRLTMSRAQLLRALQRVCLVARGEGNVTLEYASQHLRLMTAGKGQGAEDRLPAESSGQGAVVLQKWQLMAALRSLGDPTITVGIDASAGHALVRGANPTDVYLLTLMNA